MWIQVLCKNGYFNYVKPAHLDRLLKEDRVICFPRKDGFVLVGQHPTREPISERYLGVERRKETWPSQCAITLLLKYRNGRPHFRSRPFLCLIKGQFRVFTQEATFVKSSEFSIITTYFHVAKKHKQWSAKDIRKGLQRIFLGKERMY